MVILPLTLRLGPKTKQSDKKAGEGPQLGNVTSTKHQGYQER